MGNRFDPSSMPESTSEVVRLLRTFVEDTVSDEVESVETLHGVETAKLVEKSLKKVTTQIFHKNPEVHTKVKDNPNAFDDAIMSLFAIGGLNKTNG